jgi:hypothetical protein
VSVKRDLLLQILRERLVPLLVERGFEQIALSEEERRSHEMNFSFPFGYMKRLKGSDFELLEIQLAKNGAAKFVLNFGVAPPEGADVPWKHFEQQEVRVSALPEWYRLYSCRRCRRWFSPSWLVLSSNERSRATKAVDHAIALVPEIERWFAMRNVGPHMGRVGHPIRLKQAPKARSAIGTRP